MTSRGQRAVIREPHLNGIQQTTVLLLSESSRQYSKISNLVADRLLCALPTFSAPREQCGPPPKCRNPRQDHIRASAGAGRSFLVRCGGGTQARWGSSREALLPLPRTLVHHRCPAAVACRQQHSAPTPTKATKANASSSAKAPAPTPISSRHARCSA